MSFKHCQPCTQFDICPCCEIETCQVCGESWDSPHMNLSEESHDKLLDEIHSGDLMAGRFCNECTFNAYHDINDPEQENYNHHLTYKIEEYQDGTRMGAYGKAPNWKRRVVITGIKPKPNLPIRRGLFYIQSSTDQYGNEHPEDEA